MFGICFAKDSPAEPLFDPTVFWLSDTKPSALVRIFNNEDFGIQWKLRIAKWNIDENGVENLTDTQDLIASSTEVDLEPKTGKTLEISSVSIRSSEAEATYRVIFTSSVINNGGAIDVRYTHSMPIFFAPKNATKSIALSPTTNARGKLVLSIINEGTVHQFTKTIRITGFDIKDNKIFSAEQPGWYLLPQSQRKYGVNFSKKDCKRTTRIVTEVFFRDDSSIARTDNPRPTCIDNILKTGFATNGNVFEKPLQPSVRKHPSR